MNIYQHQGVFADNLATKQYYTIIEFALQQPRKKHHKTDSRYQYYEAHHVLPKSIFPEYKKSLWNKVLLTADEHFNCHKLLLDMTDGKNRSKMVCAFWYMTSAKTPNMHRTEVTGEEFAQSKLQWSEYMSSANKGRKPSPQTIAAAIKHNTGRKKDPISVEKSRLAQIGNTNVLGYKSWTNGIDDKLSDVCPGDGWYLGRTYKHSDETKQKIGESGIGRPVSDETRKKMSDKKKGIMKPAGFGIKLSAAKKGKPTNQQEIMGMRYATMGDDEFNEYISNMKSLLAKNRATNLRNKWLNTVLQMRENNIDK